MDNPYDMSVEARLERLERRPFGITETTGLTVASNPHKFHVYRNAALTSSNVITKVNFDTKLFDDSDEFDLTNDRFVATVAGYYYFSGTAGNSAASGTPIFAFLYKNGALVRHGSGNASATGVQSVVSGLFYMIPGDYMELFFVGGSGSTMRVTLGQCDFEGFLLSGEQ